MPHRFPFAGTGIVATIGRGKPVVVLRSDIDALPITELSGVPYKCAGLATRSRFQRRTAAFMSVAL